MLKKWIKVGICLLMCFSMCYGCAKKEKQEDKQTHFVIGVYDASFDESLIEVIKAQAYNEGKNYTFDITMFDSSRDFFDKYNQRQIDVVFIDSYTYSKLETKEKVIASKKTIYSKNGKSSYYRSLLLQLKNEDEEMGNHLRDYSKMSYCLLQPTSISGYIGTMPFFKEKEFSFMDIDGRLFNSYGELVEELASGSCDVISGYTNIFADYNEVWQDLRGSDKTMEEEIEVIYASDSIYESVVCIKDNLPSDFVDCLQYVLLASNYEETTNEDIEYMIQLLQEYYGG